MYNKNTKRVGYEAEYYPRKVGEILHDYVENSNEPLAVAIRERLASTANKDADITEDSLFKVIHPHTELCIDLKLLTLEPGRIKVGDFIGGVITRDSEDHYTFLQNASEKRKRVGSQRNPHVYVGYRINVNKKDDGTLYPTFNRPRFSENLTFKDFCRGAALELLSVADLIKEDEATV